METPLLLNDLLYALRVMRRSPWFTATVVATVTLAIAANTIIFSVVNAVLIRPLPYKDPGRLVQIAEKNDKLNLPTFGSSVLNFLSWREQSRSFEEIGALGVSNYTLTGSGEPEQLAGNRISPALIRLLGVSPLAGRAFTDAEENPNAAPVAILGEGFWKRRFGGDPSIIGRTIILNDIPTAVVGIAPANLNLFSGGDVYTPLTIDRAKEIRLNHVIFTVGRLKRGISIEQAQAEMNTVSARMGREYPEIRDWGIHLLTLFDSFVSPDLKTGLLMLMWAVGLVLLIACANIANLLLARAANRQNEMAVRTAIGASRTQLLRQLLVESVVISIVGGAAGCFLSVWALRLINGALPPNTLPVPSVTMDRAVFWFVLILTICTGLIFGILPAWRIATVDLSTVLKQGGRGSSGRMSTELRNGLAAVELAFATVLLIGSGLLIRSLMNLENVRLGFRSKGLITFQLAPPRTKYPIDTKAPQFYRALIDSLQSIPGVSGAVVSSGIPFGAGNYTTHPMITTEHSVLPSEAAVPVNWRIVSPGYFKTMGIPLLRGRDFTDADGPPPAQPVMIVSKSTGRKFWGDGDPIGHTLRRSAAPQQAFTIVGVVGDVRDTALNQQSPTLYYPMASRVWPLMDVAVRTHHSPEAFLPAIRRKVHELDSELALANEKTMDQWVSSSAAEPKLNTMLLSSFAFMALLIAAVGIYGVLAYSVSQRTGEIGMRMALGATPRVVLRLIVSEGMKVVLIGIGVGVIGGLALGQIVSSLVFGVHVWDPWIFVSVTVVLAGISLAACAVPAIRASRVDPIVALRYE